MARNSGRFHFDGGAGTYLGTGILAFFVILLSLGLATPFALVLLQRWRTKHTYIDGQRLMFTGTGMGLFGHFIKWWLLCVITIGIYGFWVVPRMTKWVVENTDFDPTWRPNTLSVPPAGPQTQSPPPPSPPSVSLPPAAEPAALESAVAEPVAVKKAASKRASSASGAPAAGTKPSTRARETPAAKKATPRPKTLPK